MFLLIRVPVEKTWGTTACGLRKGRIFCKGQPKLLRFRGNGGFRLFEKIPRSGKDCLGRKLLKRTGSKKANRPEERAETQRREKLLLKREISARKKKNARTVCFGGGRKENRIFGRARLRTKHCSGVQGTAFASESILSNKRF